MTYEQLEKSINSKIQDAVYKAVVQGCLLVENEAKIRCPVDTGLLRNSITHEVDRVGDLVVGTIGTNMDYAPYQEHGTGLFAEDGDGRKTRWSYQDSEGNWHSTLGQKPQPFLRPAFNALKPTIDTIIHEAVRELDK